MATTELSPPTTPTTLKAVPERASSLSLIRAAVIDERTQNVRYRQRELLSLHSALRENYTAISQAILSDTNYSSAEVDVELCLSLRCVKDAYTSLNFEDSMEEEYSVTNGKDFETRKVGAGLMFLKVANHNLVYSTIAPTAAAIAAGNCVVVQICPGYQTISTILKKVCKNALDRDTFMFVDETPSMEELTPTFIQVLQDSSYSRLSNDTSFPLVLSPSHTPTVAIVDRTADLKQAARAIVTARFSFDGKSPYAPDVVLVNEYVKKKFTSEVMRCVTEYFSDRQAGSKEHSDESMQNLLDVAREDKGTTSIMSSSKSVILSVEIRSSPLLAQKISSCVLPIHAVRSLDDSIDLANSKTNVHLASYVFADVKHAKYLSQFIKSHVSYINQIPSELIIGPAAPVNLPPSMTINRYSPSMFEMYSPQIVSGATQSEQIASILLEESRSALNDLKRDDMKELPKYKEKAVGRVDFFMQGFFLATGIIMTPVITAIGVGAFYGVRYGVRTILEKRRG